jgi:membrane carboxypeptidase/penicillin-binding protein
MIPLRCSVGSWPLSAVRLHVKSSAPAKAGGEDGQPIRIIRIMGDAGEGLVDAESRLAERMEEREDEKKKARQIAKSGDPERVRQLESFRLARTELQRQLEASTHQIRKQQLGQAIAELDRRISQLS